VENVVHPVEQAGNLGIKMAVSVGDDADFHKVWVSDRAIRMIN
jgi:hypothetical protein